MTPRAMAVAQNVVDLFAAADSSSERVTQAILGQIVTVVEEQPGFCRVTTEDRYEGWLETQRLVLPRSDTDLRLVTVSTLLADVYSQPDPRTELLTKLVAGTRAALDRQQAFGAWTPLALPDSETGWVHTLSVDLTEGESDPQEALRRGIGRNALAAALGRQAAETAKRFVGTPYLWGGCTPFGIDCSGLTQASYKLNGVQILRDARQQWADRRFRRVEEGSPLDRAILEEGDLVVFSRREDRQATHIGLALGDGRFVHARGGRGVRIDFCDTPEYTQSYLGAVRLSPDAEYSVEAA